MHKHDDQDLEPTRNVGRDKSHADLNSTRNDGLDTLNQEFKGTRNGGVEKKIRSWRTPAMAGQLKEKPPDIRKLWNEGFNKFCKTARCSI